jgi:hypothetical protein
MTRMMQRGTRPIVAAALIQTRARRARPPPLRKGRAQRPRRIVRRAIGALAAPRGQPMDK